MNFPDEKYQIIYADPPRGMDLVGTMARGLNARRGIMGY